MSATVVEINVDRTRAVTLTFDDGLVCEFPLPELRAACPCATCRARRDQGRPAWGGHPDPIEIVDATLAGAWGLSVQWNDGHDTGIYPWASLRRWYDGTSAEVSG